MRSTVLVCLCLSASFPAETRLAASEVAAGTSRDPAADFDYFRNSWATVGLKDYPTGTRVSPANELLIGGERRLQVTVGASPAPIGRSPVKRLLDGWLPVVILEARRGDVAYQVSFWASPLPDVPDWKAAFEGPVAGDDYVTWVSVRARNLGARRATARAGVRLVDGAAAEGEPLLLEWAVEPGAEAGPACWSVRSGPAGRVRSSGASKGGSAGGWIAPSAAGEAETWLRRTVDAWKVLVPARIRVPDERTMRCLLASHVNQLIGSDRGELHAGEGFYDEFYIRDGAYQILQLEEAGLLEDARRALPPFLACQRPDGRFESQAGQLDANGQALWTLWQYWRITGDREHLASVWPAMRRSAEWIRGAREEGGAFDGLLPAAVADGEFLWDGKHHIVGYDLWNLRGLLCAADAATALGKAEEAAAIAADARSYRAAIDAACLRTGLGFFPPSWESSRDRLVGTHWGNTETLWPTGIFAKDDPRVASLLAHVRRDFGGGFLEGTIRWCPERETVIHPYMSSYTTLASLRLDDPERVAEELYWYVLHASAAASFPEGIYPRRRFAWSDTIPHLLGAAQCANLIRHAVVDEEGDELHLLRGVPDSWLDPGKEIRVDAAPTWFGPLTLIVRGETAGISVSSSLDGGRAPPRRTVLHAPRSRRPLGTVPGVEVAERPDPRDRWTFDRVVEAWRSIHREPKAPDVVPLPLEGEPRPGGFRTLDLSRLANTDPFRAPFGVENPGKHLFTGMPVGRVVAAGVPFEIVDPSRNGGRGLVVLRGASAAAAFPEAVEVVVGAVAKRAFFLGHVHGWSPQDEGTGASGALAECVVRYADGTEQALPWIAGATTDDWALPPDADRTAVGLRGEPWHLNVVGIELKPVKVDRIVFRDLGTASSPVLAAVTLEP